MANHDKHHRRNKNSNNNYKNGSNPGHFPAIQPCFSGVSTAIFLVTFISIDVVVFLMEGPFLYMNIIYTLYVLIIAAFVLQILLDLGIWEMTKSGSPRTRSFLSRLCPILCICMSLPPVALLWNTKNRGGFTSDMSDISLIFSIVIVAVEVFHFAVTIFIYKNYNKNSLVDSAVRFSYTNPSPASSIRSSRIDVIMNKSRNSLASIDSGFMNTNFANTRVQRESAMDVTARFWAQHNEQVQNPYLQYGDHPLPHRHDDNIIMGTEEYRGELYSDETPKMRRIKRRDSDSSLVSGSSFSSRSRSNANYFDSHNGASRNKRRSSRDDFDLMDTHSIKSSGGSRSRSRRKPDYQGYRVEEELVYQPGYFQPTYYM